MKVYLAPNGLELGDQYLKAWAFENIKYLGQKGSILPRGYHYSGMKGFIERVKKYSIDPKERFLISRAEMDQGWKNEYYSLNIDMNIYWSVLNALHGGLAVWDVTKSF